MESTHDSDPSPNESARDPNRSRNRLTPGTEPVGMSQSTKIVVGTVLVSGLLVAAIILGELMAATA